MKEHRSDGIASVDGIENDGNDDEPEATDGEHFLLEASPPSLSGQLALVMVMRMIWVMMMMVLMMTLTMMIDDDNDEDEDEDGKFVFFCSLVMNFLTIMAHHKNIGLPCSQVSGDAV